MYYDALLGFLKKPMSLPVLRGKCTAQGIQLVQGMSLEFVYHLSVAFLG